MREKDLRRKRRRLRANNENNQNQSTDKSERMSQSDKEIPINRAEASMFVNWRQDNAAFSEATPEQIARFRRLIRRKRKNRDE